MEVSQVACAHCGTVNEIITRSRSADLIPLCRFCQKPVKESRKIEFVSEQGGLFIQHIPGKGLGVFTRTPQREGALVERCPAYVVGTGPFDVHRYLAVLMLQSAADAPAMSANHLFLPWAEDGKCFALGLGYAMLYNHAPLRHSNLRYRPYTDPDTQRRYIDFYAKKDIDAFDELTQTYNSPDKLWFSPRKDEP